MRRPRLAFLAAVALSALTGGCQRHPFDEKVDARNDLGFSLWLSDHAGSLTVAEQRELTEARQQIKLAVMCDSPGLPTAEFHRAVYTEIYGHTVREVLIRSLEIQAERIASEIRNLEDREERYRQVDATRLALPAREFLDGFHARMAKRRSDLQRLDEQKLLVLAHR